MLVLTVRGFSLAVQNPLEHMILLTFLQFWTILKPMSAFGYFSQFQLGRPEPLRNASFYQHSFNFTWFWSQWILFLLFVVSAWPPRTPLEHMILLAFLQFCVILKPMGGFAYFPRFEPSCPEPLQNQWFYLHSFNLHKFEDNGCFCLLFAVSDWPPRTSLEHMI